MHDALWTCEEDKNGKDIFHAAKPNRFAFADFTFVEIFFFLALQALRTADTDFIAHLDVLVDSVLSTIT